MQPNDPLDRIRVRIFTLADHAAGPPDLKLYINGAGVHVVPMPNAPGPIMTPLAVVIRLYIPYAQTTEPHGIIVRILDEDSEPVGPDPIFQAPNVELGRAPGTRAGDENAVNLVL